MLTLNSVGTPGIEPTIRNVSFATNATKTPNNVKNRLALGGILPIVVVVNVIPELGTCDTGNAANERVGDIGIAFL
jgi:hypothetical protein